ncbi:T9SS sorting signal type C domain-containing protein [Psychroserpens ponticola]|uniref:T9SS sorting signal type C domain-containing protein n=1 Tax=Psychroserpens ponticola TaxID=2932268 RepID=A0ABY7RYQ0_9FLAO|nr:T9SS sorting signal type C domain-containing protein [Psychroserpens ponticola]WCO02202.1 T9SS sorting signal type C domain-containing protein [Psychroserpens ponticola]
MIKKLLLILLLIITPISALAQDPDDDCGAATVPLALIPGGTYSTGLQSTLGHGNDYSNAIMCIGGSPAYGAQEDAVYLINVTVAGNYTFEFTNAGNNWKSLSVHSACAPTNGNCVGAFYTNASNTGTAATGAPLVVNLPVGSYYIVIDAASIGDPYAEYVLEITSPIANDDPCGAISLTVNPDYSCTNTSPGTVENATDSGIGPAACGGTEDDDVWFSFVATGTSHTVDLINVAGSTIDLYHALYGGFIAPDCSVAVGDNFGCSDFNSSILTGLTSGETYFIQVFTWTGTTGQDTTFDICIGTPPPPPSNDNPCNAEVLSVNTPCSYSTFTTDSATATGGVPNPGCASYNGGDVWFSATVPAGGSIIIDTNDIDFTDSGMALYQGPCNSLTFIECDDDGSANANMSSISASGLTPGSTVFIRVWVYGNNNISGNFGICVSEPPPPPTNTDCASADDMTCGQSISATTNGVTGSSAHGSGCTMSDYGVWYHFVGDGNITTIDVTPSGGYDTELAVMQGSCGSLTNIDCDDAFGTDSYTFTTTNLTDYYVYVAHYGSGSTTTGDFTISLTCTPPNCTVGPGTGTSSLGLPNLMALDTNGNNPTTTSCGAVATVDIEATYLQLGDPSAYNVASIPYNPPYQFDCLANQFSTFNDDTWSPVVPMNFDFCFYDNAAINAFSQLQVTANGVISFDSFTPGDNCGYINDWNVPNAINSDGIYGTEFYGRSIYGVHHDIDPSQGGEVGYETITLDTGERAFIMSWHDIPMFSDNSILYTGMMVLYEHSNVIDVYIEEKNIDDNDVLPWNDGNATVAIQNDASTGLAAPNRNSLNNNWNATQEAWRFTPSGGGLGSISNLTWYEGSATANGNTTTGLTSIGSTDVIAVAPTSDTTYTAEIIYTFCDGTTLSRFEEILVQISSTKIWNGSVNTDWFVNANWTPSGFPTAADCVIIPVTANDPIISDDTHGDGLNLTIYADATLTLKTNSSGNNFASSLTIQDYIDIQGVGINAGNLIVEDDASLIQVFDISTPTTLPTAINTGNIELYRNTADIRPTDYVYWSSPIESHDVSTIYGANTPSYIYEWVPTTGTVGNGPGPDFVPICYGYWNPLPSGGAMNAGKGYIVRAPTNQPAGLNPATSLFTGVPNNGVITEPIFSGENTSLTSYFYNPYGVDLIEVTRFDDNWNLLGNPYPSALDALSFLTHPDNALIEGAVHIWTHGIQIGNNGDSFYDDFAYTYSVNDYTTFNHSGTNVYNDQSFGGKIASGQGFFVLALNDDEDGSNTVTFNNSMRDRSHSNTVFYRTTNEDEATSSIERNRIWLNLIDQNESTSSIMVGYIEGATQEKDRLFDAFTREVNELNIYSKIGNQRMIIQGRALPFNENDQIPLGTVIPSAGEYTIAISNVDGLFLNDNQPIYLEDTLTGIIHDLRAAPYTFSESEAIDYEHRFILRYTNEALSINELEYETDLTIIAPKGDFIKVYSERSMIESVIVYDLLGRILFDVNSINETTFILNNHNLSSGAYIVKATLTNGQTKAQKIVLKD